MTPLLTLDDVTLGYGRVHVVKDLSLSLPAGPAGVALVGESGSGKTTAARAMLGLLAPVQGRVEFEGRNVTSLTRVERKAYRRSVQPVFQDGTEALDPRMRIRAALGEALSLSPDRSLRGDARDQRIQSLLDDVGLPAAVADRLPHQISGGQRQRVCIARALAVQPRALVLDEPTSALDVTVQSRVLALLSDLRREHDLSYLLITHNLSIVPALCDRTAVMFDGRLVEEGPTARVLARPAHPYTAALIYALPKLGGAPPEASGRSDRAPASTGCAFRSRCALAVDRCTTEIPKMREVDGRMVACHRAEVQIRDSVPPPQAAQ